MQRLRTALVGCGKVGSIHAQALRDLPESDFVAVCDSDPSRAAAFAARFNTRAYPDLDAMLSEARPQALLVCTPHPLHAGPVVRAAAAGVHALVEKPLAATLVDCDRMLEASRCAGTKLGVISQRRFYEPVQRMKSAIAAGKVG
jgi:predicted dehydrogenase